MEKMIDSFNEAETFSLGRQFGEKAMPGDVFVLSGDLGAGKTVFAKGFAEGLGVASPVTSPTFTILKSYEEGRIPLYHMDVYRIEDPDEMEEIGISEMLDGSGTCLIEWGEKIREILPPSTVYVVISRTDDGRFDHRRIVCSS